MRTRASGQLDPQAEKHEPSPNGGAPPVRRGQVRVEPGRKRVRAYLGGVVVADSIAPLLVWEVPYYPTYYFPEGDVRAELVADGGVDLHYPSRGDAKTLSVLTAGSRAVGAAARYEDSPIDELRGTIRLQWDAMEAWFEEDEQVYTHPRDPYTRVDILASSRNVRVLLDGLVLADSRSPRLLFETGLPTRHYLPRTHVRMDLLERSSTVTHCRTRGGPRRGACERARCCTTISRGPTRPRCLRARRWPA
jgi:uncharacterized protein (DUF427 family)